MPIELTVTTKSNLYIGGVPQTFEIGGVDMYTATDYDGKPYIPASSLKGALREIVKDKDNYNEEIAELYKNYLCNKKDAFEENIKGNDTKAKEDYEKRIKDEGKELHLSIFGIGSFNHSPKLIFTDLELSSCCADETKWFSIDMKNSIEEDNENLRLKSNPRSYKTARKGLKFKGTIHLYRAGELGTTAADMIEDYVIKCLEEFNAGVYRIGNSKSRGYGWIKVEARRK